MKNIVNKVIIIIMIIMIIIICIHLVYIIKTNKLQEQDYENLELFNECIVEADIFYWVGEGTALGFIREGGIIENDSDVDIGMYYENKEKYYEKCLPLLLNKGFTIMRNNPHSVIRHNRYIDVDFIGIGKPAMTYNWPETPDNWIKFLEPFSKITVRGVTYNIPSLQYIEYLYGDNWKTPSDLKPNQVNKN